MSLIERLFGRAPRPGRRDLKRELSLHALEDRLGKPKRRPPEAGSAMPAVPPRGPLPLQGGAEAPLG